MSAAYSSQSGSTFQENSLRCLLQKVIFFQYVQVNSSAKPQRRFIKIYFHNKGIDKVNLTNILHNKLVKSKVTIYFQEQDPPLISYKYTNTISRSVSNYNQPSITLISMIIVMHLHLVTARRPPFAMSLTAMLLLEIYPLLRIENCE